MCVYTVCYSILLTTPNLTSNLPLFDTTLYTDKVVCNGVIPHPYLPALASYGIDNDVKIWASATSIIMTGDTCGEANDIYTTTTGSISSDKKQYITKNNYYKYEIKETNIKPDVLYTKSPPKSVYSKMIELPCILESYLVSILFMLFMLYCVLNMFI